MVLIWKAETQWNIIETQVALGESKTLQNHSCDMFFVSHFLFTGKPFGDPVYLIPHAATVGRPKRFLTLEEFGAVSAALDVLRSTGRPRVFWVAVLVNLTARSCGVAASGSTARTV